MFKKMFFISLVCLFSCDHRNDTPINISLDIFLEINDSQGYDLLDPAQKKIDSNEIEVFYATQQGKMLKVYNPKLDNPKGYRLVTPDGDNSKSYKVHLYLNSEYLDSDNISFTYIKWSAAETDQVKAQFIKDDNNFMVNKIWVNNELRWEIGKEKSIKIIKDL